MEEKDIIIRLKKTKKDLENIKKIIVKLKSLNLVINIFYGFNSICYALVIRY